MQVIDEPKLPGHRRPHHLEAAVVVVEMQAREPADEKIEDPRRHGFVPRIESRRLPAVDEVGRGSGCSGRRLEQREHAGNLSWVVLPVAVEHREGRPLAATKAGRQRHRLAPGPIEPDAGDPRILSHTLDLLPGGIGRSVVDDKCLPGEPLAVENLTNFGDQRGDVPRLIAHGNDE